LEHAQADAATRIAELTAARQADAERARQELERVTTGAGRERELLATRAARVETDLDTERGEGRALMAENARPSRTSPAYQTQEQTRVFGACPIFI